MNAKSSAAIVKTKNQAPPRPVALQWEAFEFIYIPKTADWYWVLWIITIAIAVGAFLLGNWSLSLLVVISALAFSLLAIRRPKQVTITLDDRYVSVNDRKHRLDAYSGFKLVEDELKILFLPHKMYLPLTTIPLELGAQTGQIRNLLDEAGLEENDEIQEPFLNVLMSRLGI